MFMFADLKELKEVENYLDYRYIRLLKWSLNSLAAWPKRQLGEPETIYYKLQNIALLIHTSCCVTGTMLYIKNHSKSASFYDLGHMYITTFMAWVTISRLLMTMFHKYREVTGFFFKKMHLNFHKDKSPYAMKTHIQVHKMSHFFTVYLHAMMFMGILLFNMTPVYKNYLAGMFSSDPPINGTFEHAVYYELPFDCYANRRGYYILFSFNWIASYFCSASFCIYDLLISLLIFHLWGHLKILKNNFETFPKPNYILGNKEQPYTSQKEPWEAEMYKPVEMVQVLKLLAEYIEHHKLILDFNDMMSELFGPIILIYYAFHQISGCLLLLLCSQLDPNALIQYGPLTIIIFQQLIQISIIFELVGSMSEKLIPAVYDIPWDSMDIRGRRIALILLCKVQSPMHLKALGMADVGVNTMASILKTSLSYFTFLRTVSE